MLRSLINLSYNLQFTDVKITGLTLSDLFLEPFYNNGMMFAFFHSKGTTPSFYDKLNTLASGVLICSTVSISRFGRIPSTPGDLLSFIAFIYLATISGVTISCPK